MCATTTLLSPGSPSSTPGFADTTPAIRASYGAWASKTSLVCVGLSTTTVPSVNFRAAGTHSATSWYLAAKFPATVTLPVGSSVIIGVPPELVIVRLELIHDAPILHR